MGQVSIDNIDNINNTDNIGTIHFFPAQSPRI